MSKFKIEVKWAIIFITTILGWSVLEKVAGLHDKNIEMHATFSAFFMLPAILVYFLAIRDKKHNYYDGNMNFSHGFMAGLWVTIFVAICNPLTQWLISFVITPEYFENVIAYSVENEMSTLEEATAYFNYQSYVIQGTIGTLIIGIVTSVILALLLKTRKR